MEKVLYKVLYKDTGSIVRIELDNPHGLKPGDSFQRNGENISSIFEMDYGFLIKLHIGEDIVLNDKASPVIVWRAKNNLK